MEKSTIHLPQDLHKQLKAFAALEGLKLQELVERILRKSMSPSFRSAILGRRPRRSPKGGDE